MMRKPGTPYRILLHVLIFDINSWTHFYWFCWKFFPAGACSDVSRDLYSGQQVLCGDGVWVGELAFYMTGGEDGETGLIPDDAYGSPGGGPCPVRSTGPGSGWVSLLWCVLETWAIRMIHQL